MIRGPPASTPRLNTPLTVSKGAVAGDVGKLYFLLFPEKRCVINVSITSFLAPGIFPSSF